MLGLPSSSNLDWGCYFVSIAKTASKRIEALICSMKFLSPEVTLYLSKSIIQPSVEYWSYVWTGAPRCYLEMLDKQKKKKQMSWTVGSSLAAPLEPLAYHRNLGSLS